VDAIPPRRISAPVGLPIKAVGKSALTLSSERNPISGVYRHDPPSGKNTNNGGVTFPPPSGVVPLTGHVDRWMDVVTTSEWGKSHQ